MGPQKCTFWKNSFLVSFLNHIASILYEHGFTCGAVYPLFYNYLIGCKCLIKARVTVPFGPKILDDLPQQTDFRSCLGLTEHARTGVPSICVLPVFLIYKTNQKSNITIVKQLDSKCFFVDDVVGIIIFSSNHHTNRGNSLKIRYSLKFVGKL